MTRNNKTQTKWLAACLFSATVLAGLQLQMAPVSADTITTTVTTTNTNTNNNNGVLSGIVTGSFAHNPGGSTTTTSSTTSNSGTSTETSGADVTSAVASGAASGSSSTAVSSEAQSSSVSASTENTSSATTNWFSGATSGVSVSASSSTPATTSDLASVVTSTNADSSAQSAFATSDATATSNASYQASLSASYETSSSNTSAISSLTSSEVMSSILSSLSATSNSATSSIMSDQSTTSSLISNAAPASASSEAEVTATTGELIIHRVNGLTQQTLSSTQLTVPVGPVTADSATYVSQLTGYGYVGDLATELPTTFTTGVQSVTLTYMPLSAIVVRYVDATDPTHVLWTYTLPTNYATLGQTYQTNYTDLPFSGYQYVYATSNATGTIRQTVQSLTNANSVVVTYYYKPISSTNQVDTSSWQLTTATTQVTGSSAYSIAVSLNTDQSTSTLIGSIGPVVLAGNSATDVSNPATTTGELKTNVATDTTTTTSEADSTNIHFVTSLGTEVGQTTVTGQTGTRVNDALNPTLTDLRQQGYVVLNNGVSPTQHFGNTEADYTVKVSKPDTSANPFKRPTMPLVAQLGNASTSVSVTHDVTSNELGQSPAAALNNLSTTGQNATRSTTSTDQPTNSAQATPSASAQSTNQQSNSNNSTNHATNSNNNTTNAAQQQQNIAKKATTKTALDNQQSEQVHRDAVANDGQSHGSGSAIGGGGSNPVTGLAAYFISLNGKINLGARN